MLSSDLNKLGSSYSTNLNSHYYFLLVSKHCIIKSPNVGELQAESTATTDNTDENMLHVTVQLLLSQSEVKDSHS
jgi:hypothetical protein